MTMILVDQGKHQSKLPAKRVLNSLDSIKFENSDTKSFVPYFNERDSIGRLIKNWSHNNLVLQPSSIQ